MNSEDVMQIDINRFMLDAELHCRILEKKAISDGADPQSTEVMSFVAARYTIENARRNAVNFYLR